MDHRIAYYRRCLREWRARFGPLSGTRLWIWLQLQRLHPLRSEATLRLPGMPIAITLRSNGSDLSCFEQIFVHQELAFEIPDANVDLIIDAGANIGLATITLANRFPHATIVALEVDAENFRMLKINTRGYPRVIALNKALWHDEGHVKIENPAAAAWSFRVVSAAANDPAAISAVNVESILRLVNRESVALLKMDIEGAEFEMFASADSWLQSVRMLAVEIHESIRPGVTALFNATIRPTAQSCIRHGEYEVLCFR